jgi:hypothetical protein
MIKRRFCLLLPLFLLLLGCQRAAADVFEPQDLTAELLAKLEDANELTKADDDYLETNLPTLAGKGVVYFGEDDICELGVFRLKSTAAANDALSSIRAYIAEEREVLLSLAALYPSDDMNERLWCYDHAKAERAGTLVYYFIMDAESLSAAESIVKDLK